MVNERERSKLDPSSHNEIRTPLIDSSEYLCKRGGKKIARSGHTGDEQGERLHQDIREMASRYQGKWNVNIMADHCWTLKRDVPDENRKRKRNTLRRSFEDKRVRHKRITA
ncbi:uncharacterized protein LOC141537273 [Cotesia typhae]|uniref:uncharacterized protein LOC141537273 n=1 Tax=Cotesia typhae TaxID=2053667 RepID=UPI003D6843C7